MLSVDAAAVICIIFDLDRQVTADRFDEHSIVDRDMRMLSSAMLLASRRNPFEIVLIREDNFVIATIVDVLERIAIDQKLERLGVGRRFSDAKHQKQMRSNDVELRKLSVFVVFVQREKFVFESAAVQQVQRLSMHGSVAKLENSKDIRQFRPSLQTHVNVVAENKPVPDRHDVPWEAVILSRDPLVRDQLSRDRAKHITPLIVQLP